MKLLDQVRERLSKYFLDVSPSSKRRVKLCNFDQATSVGIIYKEKNESFYILVKQYVKHLKAEHGIREVLALAYVDDKQIPFWQVQKLEFEYFSKSDLDWRLKPTSREVDRFLGKDFDILLDFTLDVVPSLQYVLANSQSQFKVGAWHPQKKDLFDMMVDLNNQNTFDQYLKKLNHFLTILNKKKDAQPA